jgi:hypothetical protein
MDDTNTQKGTTMIEFNTKAEMVEAYAREMAHKNLEVYGHGPEAFAGHLAICRMVAAEKAKYSPHICNLGWFIRGFGFSTERVELIARIPGGRQVFQPLLMEAD